MNQETQAEFSDVNTTKFINEWVAFCLRNGKPDGLKLDSVEGTAFLQGYQAGMSHAAAMVQVELNKARNEYVQRFN